MSGLAWPGLAWAAQRASKGSTKNSPRGGGNGGAALWAPAGCGHLFLGAPSCLGVWDAGGIPQCHSPSARMGRGRASRSLEPLCLGRHHMTSGPRPSWECWLQLPAEPWHQQAPPGEMPGHPWGRAYARGSPLSVASGLGWEEQGLGPNTFRVQRHQQFLPFPAGLAHLLASWFPASPPLGMAPWEGSGGGGVEFSQWRCEGKWWPGRKEPLLCAGPWAKHLLPGFSFIHCSGAQGVRGVSVSQTRNSSELGQGLGAGRLSSQCWSEARPPPPSPMVGYPQW